MHTISTLKFKAWREMLRLDIIEKYKLQDKKWFIRLAYELGMPVYDSKFSSYDPTTGIHC